jgi:hypothetical protein
MTIDDYIEQRNAIQFKAEAISEEIAAKCWIELGVANRHIERVLNGLLSLPIVEQEIIRCLQRVDGLI